MPDAAPQSNDQYRGAAMQRSVPSAAMTAGDGTMAKWSEPTFHGCS